MTLTQDYLKHILKYNPKSGTFVWLSDRSQRVKKGDVAGTLRPDGYHKIKINGKNFLAHRLAILYMKGYMPNMDVDHLNGIRNDNRWNNLKDCSRSECRTNVKPYKGNFKGVQYCKSKNRWMSVITIKSYQKVLGRYVDMFDAISMIIRWRKEHGIQEHTWA